MKYVAFITTAALLSPTLVAEEPSDLSEPPPYTLFRAAEDYSYLANDEQYQYKPDWFDPIKYIPLSRDRNVYLTVGGEFRARYELFTNRNWTAKLDEETLEPRKRTTWVFTVTRRDFNDVAGKETRHTIGIRRMGALGRWRYNTELIYRFGEIAGQTIRAYNVETDWHYDLIRTRWRPSIGS